MPSSGSTTSRMASVSVSTDGSTADPAGGAPVVAADIVAADIVVSVTERSPRASVRSALSGRRRPCTRRARRRPDNADRTDARGDRSVTDTTMSAATMSAATRSAATMSAATTGAPPAGSPVDPSVETLTEAMRDVVDPELGINVVDLGLVYGISLDPAAEGQVAVVDMTLTSAACPLTDVIEEQTRSALAPFVDDFRINWVWMPPWGPDKITDDGRDQLRALGFNV